MSQKKTSWFDGSVKPVHKGVYETIAEPGIPVAFQRWDGKCWYFRSFGPIEADRVLLLSQFQSPQWRGLKQKPA